MCKNFSLLQTHGVMLLAATDWLALSKNSVQCWCGIFRSADTSTLLVPTTRRSTLGDGAFPAAAARAWNSLPCHVRDMPSLLAFRRELKTVLFRLSYPVD